MRLPKASWVLTIVLSFYTCLASARTEPRDILVTLGNMEFASESNIPDGWYQIGDRDLDHTIILDSSVAAQGRSSLRISCSLPNTGQQRYKLCGIRRPTGSGNNGLKTGDRLELTADVKTGSIFRGRVVILVDAVRADNTVSTQQLIVITESNTPWRNYRASITMPEDAVLAGVSIMAGVEDGGQVQFWVDNVRLTNGELIEVPVKKSRTIRTFTFYRMHPDVYETARRYDKVFLAPQNWLYARALRYYNPEIEVYVHFSAVSTFRNHDSKWDPLDYHYVSRERPEWFLRDSAGNPIQERFYPGAYMVDIGNAQLQQRWSDRTVQFALLRGFSGVSLDNVVRGLLSLNGVSSVQYPDDNSYHQAMTSFLQAVTARIRNAGLKVGANFGWSWTSDEHPYSTWMNHVDCALTENWVRFYDQNTQSYGFLSVGGQLQHILAQERQGTIHGLILGRATNAEVEVRRYLYGCALLNYNSRTHFHTADAGYKEVAHYLPDYELAIGVPMERYTLIAGNTTAGGVLRRKFTNGIVLVNIHPSQEFTVELDADYIDANGVRYSPGNYALPARRALILAKPANHIQITLSQSTNTPKPGEVIQITVTVRNASTQTVKEIWVRVPTPNNLRYVVGSASDGGIYDSSWRVVAWYIPDLAPGSAVERRFRLQMD